MNRKITLGSVIILILIILELFLSSYLAYQTLTSSDTCLIGQQSQCQEVQNSSYGKLFGIKLAYLAVFAFLILLILYFTNQELFFLAAIFGAGASAYFILLQWFVLKQQCSTCLVIDGMMILIFLSAGIKRLVKRRKEV